MVVLRVPGLGGDGNGDRLPVALHDRIGQLLHGTDHLGVPPRGRRMVTSTASTLRRKTTLAVTLPVAWASGVW
ncbi:hypothetical protein GCM10023084_71350 [Streptomyces lacrimifluminis]|uniref:Uncharacterized protein n=1 Tax=Streptomyces lacrimifluminis TaxID=1500077 RepID=A0A917UMS8_9ACTN|nr:hypothetical protein GCM10012282_77440 [Streptomyces lacrimifluminis]